MDIVLYTIHPVSLICIIIMVGAIIYAYFRKLMITYAIVIANFIVFILSFAFAPNVVTDLAFRPIYLSFELFLIPSFI